MKYELTNVEPIAGYAAHSAADGQNALMVVSAFLTPDGTSTFYTIMEESQGHFLGPYLDRGGKPSMIDHFLVILRRDRTATVYINELIVEMQCVMNKAMPAGSPVRKRDVIGIGEAKIRDVTIPKDCAFVFFVSHGWRRGLVFDFRPMHEDGVDIQFEKLIGRVYESLWFADLFSIPADLWPAIFGTGWFPFVALIGGLFEELPSFLERNILAAWEKKVIDSFDAPKFQLMLDNWKTVPQLESHLEILQAGVERYLSGDYVSSINNIWPRIEGILRFLYEGSETRPGQRKVVDNVWEALQNKAILPETYMPDLFREYLLAFYYAGFNVRDGMLDVSRHSVAHGVSTPDDYSQKKALIGLFIVQQLYYYVKLGWNEPPSPEPASTSTQEPTGS